MRRYTAGLLIFCGFVQNIRTSLILLMFSMFATRTRREHANISGLMCDDCPRNRGFPLHFADHIRRDVVRRVRGGYLDR